MANTYTQIYLQIVFAVKHRESLILEPFRDRLEKYICGIVNKKDQKPLAIYCMPDHVHLLVGLKPTMAASELVRDIKSNSSKFINEAKLLKFKFAWQEGFGAFSYAHSQLTAVIHYINNQPNHHKKCTFREEYLNFLKKFEVDYDENYLFNWLD